MRPTEIAASSVLCLREIHLKPQSPRCGRQWKLLLQISDPGTDERQVVRKQPVWWVGLRRENNYAVTPLPQLVVAGRNSVHHPKKHGGKGGKRGQPTCRGGLGLGLGRAGVLLEPKV